MKHEEFLKQVKLGATYFKYMNGSPSDGQDDVLKLLAIIEKLKEQRAYAYKSIINRDVESWAGSVREWSAEDDKELDEIVGMG